MVLADAGAALAGLLAALPGMATGDVSRLGLPESEGHRERTEGAAGNTRQ
jgi:hypothetical protein